MAQIKLGYSTHPIALQTDKLNRHGIIAGATGTGKTITLKVLAEQLSQAGIPVFLSDIKGDIMSIVDANSGEGLEDRLKATHYDDYEPQGFPVHLWDVSGESGIPLRMTVSEMGPVLLARLLGLNETQAGILNIVFSVADEQGLLLIDLMDLRAMLNYVGEHAKELSGHYGNISKASIGVILRSILVLENQGGQQFFGEPAIELDDFFSTDEQGRGYIHILNAIKLYNQPILYSTVLLALLSELFEQLPEVGDLDNPKMVFFFDEAHSLFKDTPKALVDKIEQVVRLIRSKGIGVFFVTQNPTDLPDSVSSQLGHRIQHGLRAYTPKEIRTIQSVAETFRQDDSMDLPRVIQDLQVGEAVVSVLDSDGVPTSVEKAIIYPPMSKIGTIEPSRLLQVINQSDLMEKYGEMINRESAHEVLQALVKEQEEALIQAGQSAEVSEVPLDTPQKDSIFDTLKEAVTQSAQPKRRRNSDSPMDRFTKNMMSAVGREMGRAITRGITGMFNHK